MSKALHDCDVREAEHEEMYGAVAAEEWVVVGKSQNQVQVGCRVRKCKQFGMGSSNFADGWAARNANEEDGSWKAG